MQQAIHDFIADSVKCLLQLEPTLQVRACLDKVKTAIEQRKNAALTAKKNIVSGLFYVVP